MDTSNLISCAIVAQYGVAGREQDILAVADELRQHFAFFEVLIVLPVVFQDTVSDQLRRQLAVTAPQTRVIILNASPHFEDISVEAYQSALGDVVVVIDADELGVCPIMDLVTPILHNARLVRLKRESNPGLGIVSSLVVRLATGYPVDTSFCRTMALSRALLSELLPSTEKLILFRFMLGRSPLGSVVLNSRVPPQRKGMSELSRRLDLLVRLLMAATPRLLRQAALVCGLISAVGVLVLGYVMLNLAFNPELVEGWATTNTLVAVLMTVQMAAMGAICLGISKMLDGNKISLTSRRVDEWAAGDLFGRSNLLNVETGNWAQSAKDFTAHPVDLGVGSLDKGD